MFLFLSLKLCLDDFMGQSEGPTPGGVLSTTELPSPTKLHRALQLSTSNLSNANSGGRPLCFPGLTLTRQWTTTAAILASSAGDGCPGCQQLARRKTLYTSAPSACPSQLALLQVAYVHESVTTATHHHDTKLTEPVKCC